MHRNSLSAAPSRRSIGHNARAAFVVLVVIAAMLFLTPSRPAAAGTNSQFVVDADTDSVIGSGWMPNSTVTIEIHNLLTGESYTTHQVLGPTSGFGVSVAGHIDLQWGCFIEVSDGANTKQHEVRAIRATTWDDAADTVSGLAWPAATVSTWIPSTGKHLNTTADGEGHWTVDYSGLSNVTVGTVMMLQEFDDDGDSTQTAITLPVADIDGDGFDDDVDNCPHIVNPVQYDGDGDGVGLLCDDVERLWGTNRYATSAAVYHGIYYRHVGAVIIALGTNFPDALVAAAAGASSGVPVLLTDGSALSPETAAELEGSPFVLGGLIVGGEAAITPNVEEQLKAIAPQFTRLAGADRYATSAVVCERAFSTADTVFIALGTNFPDALVASAAAGAIHAPVLLTSRDHVPQPTLDQLTRLNPKTIYIVGGTAAVSRAVENQLEPYASKELIRLAGRDRYATSAAVAEEIFDSATKVYLASGANFPDALVAAAPAGAYQSPVLLVTRDAIPASTREQLDRLKPEQILVVGGPAVVGNGVYAALP